MARQWRTLSGFPVERVDALLDGVVPVTGKYEKALLRALREVLEDREGQRDTLVALEGENARLRELQDLNEREARQFVKDSAAECALCREKTDAAKAALKDSRQ